MVISPASALSIPPRIFSNVDLPEPDGPRSTQNSPFPTVKSSSLSTSCLVSPLPKLFLSPRTSRNFLSFSLLTFLSLRHYLYPCNHYVYLNTWISIHMLAQKMTIVKDFSSISAVLILSGNIGHLYKLVYTNIIVLTMLHQIVWHKNEYTKNAPTA